MTASVETDDFENLAAARDLWARGSLDDALDAFAAAVRFRPLNVKALVEAARAHGSRFEIDVAERYLERAWRLSVSDPRVSASVAASYGRIHREQRAIELLQGVDRRSPSARAALAALLERVNRLEPALAEIEACLSTAPEAPELWLAKGRILRRRGDAGPAHAALRRALSLARAPAVLAEAWTEICYLHDRAGEHDAAVEAIEKAHAIIRATPAAPKLLRQAHANNRAITALSHAFQKTRPTSWRVAAPDPRVGGVAHLIGFPRSGTTLLEQRLDAHPDLIASPERVAFLRDALPALCRAGGGALTMASLDAAPENVLTCERRRYLDSMEAALGAPLGGRTHLDKNPNHTGLLPGLLRLFPESRFVVSLRDPRDVVTSCVLRTFRVTEFSVMLLDWRSAAELYAVEMGAWLRYRAALDPAQWVETRYEDGLDAPEREMQRVLDRLDLPWDDAVSRYRERIQTKLVDSPTQTEVREPPSRRAVGRWRAYERHLAPHLHILQPFVDAFGYG